MYSRLHRPVWLLGLVAPFFAVGVSTAQVRLQTSQPGAAVEAEQLFDRKPLQRTHALIPDRFIGLAAVASGDLNGDGRADLMFNSASEGGFVFFGDGRGTFRKGLSSFASKAGEGTFEIHLGDVDGDGDLDAYLDNISRNIATGERDRLYINGGSGHLVEESHRMPVIQNSSRTFLTDVDVDGDPDIVVWRRGGPPANFEHSLFLNDGTGVFSEATGLMPGMLEINDVVMGDFDADGDPDALVALGYYDTFSGTGTKLANRLFLNDGSGKLVRSFTVPSTPRATPRLTLADVDGDGDLDALVGNSDDLLPHNELWRNSGAGTFTSEVASLSGATSAVSLWAAADMDLDGDTDLLSADRIWLNDSTGNFPAWSGLPAGIGSADAVLVDIDSDGDFDGVGGDRAVYLNDGMAKWTAIDRAPWGVLACAFNRVVADFDGDGWQDVFFGQSCTRDRLYMSTGPGSHTNASFSNLPPNPLPNEVRDIASGDVDGDGDIDMVLACWNQNNPLRLYLNQGDGSFVNPAVFSPGAGSRFSVELGDVDGNGTLDVLVGAAYLPALLYLGDGHGGFVDASSMLPPSAMTTGYVSLGDIDGDGDLDVLCNETTAAPVVWENDGTGLFTEKPFPASIGTYVQLALEDLDLDGDLDVLSLRFQDRFTSLPIGNWLFRNDGLGNFSEEPDALGVELASLSDVAVGDLDQDGSAEVMVVGWPRSILFRDSGQGNLVPVAEYGAAIGGEFVDWDADGDLDAFLEDEVLLNVRRQVAWAMPPRLGKPLTLSLWGDGNAQWFVSGSASPATFASSPGVRILDPAALTPLGAGFLPPSGTERVHFPFASLPALVGQAMYVQALIGHPFETTNIERLEFTDL